MDEFKKIRYPSMTHTHRHYTEHKYSSSHGPSLQLSSTWVASWGQANWKQQIQQQYPSYYWPDFHPILTLCFWDQQEQQQDQQEQQEQNQKKNINHNNQTTLMGCNTIKINPVFAKLS